MILASILFEHTEEETPGSVIYAASAGGEKTPLGEERVLRFLLGEVDDRQFLLDTVAVPKWGEGKIRKAVSVVPVE